MAKEKTKSRDYYECKRCDINSETKDRWCPCPRGGCEAQLVGEVLIVKKIVYSKRK